MGAARAAVLAALLAAVAGALGVGKTREMGDTTSLIHLRTELSSRLDARQDGEEPITDFTSTHAFLSMNSSTVAYGALLNITIQRINFANETATDRQQDFVGLYWVEDKYVDQPWNWVETNNRVAKQTVTMEANKGGDMEIRLVRPPNQILARVPLKVFSPCNPICFKHGACHKGQCECNVGYAWGAREYPCMSPDGETMLIEGFDLYGNKQFQQGMHFTINVTTDYPVEYNGNDYIGVYPNGSKNGSMAVAWKVVPKGRTTTGQNFTLDFPAIKTAPGLYVFRFTRKHDMEVQYESEPFPVYEFCPRDCTNHGMCIEGVCVCDPGMTGVDCSLGEAMVQLTPDRDIMFKNGEVLISFDREYDEKYPFLLSDSDWIGMYAPNDTDITRPYAYLYAQAADGTSPGPNATLRKSGTVNFTVPIKGDQFQFKYIRNDHTVMAETPAIDVYLPCSPEDCSGHGTCSGHAFCNCTEGWRGAGCEIGDVMGHLLFNDDNVLAGTNLSVQFTRGLGSAHDEDYIGLFQLNASVPDLPENAALAHAHRQAFLVQAKDVDTPVDTNDTTADTDAPLTGLLYSYALANASQYETGALSNSEGGDVEVAVPLSGTFVLRYVDVVDQVAKGESTPFTVWPACPLDCSERGQCYQGVCNCPKDYLAPDCKRFKGTVTLQRTADTAPVILGEGLMAQTTFSVQYNRPPGWYEAGDFVGLYAVPTDANAGINIQQPMQLVYAKEGDGDQLQGLVDTVEFKVSSLTPAGYYKAVYVSGITFESVAESGAFAIQPTCGTGNFDLVEGKCVCPADKDGPACEQDTCCYSLTPSALDVHPDDKVTVQWTRPNKAGRDQDLIALYFANATGQGDELRRPYAFAFANGNESADGNSGSVELKMPPKEEAYKVLYVSSADFSLQGSSEELVNTIVCDPVGCSGHGVCLQGVCECSGLWAGAGCDKQTTAVPELNMDLSAEIVEGGAFSVGWGRPPDVGGKGDYIGIYMEGDPYNKPKGYNFVPVGPEAFTGTVQLVAPNTAGEYQLRWILAKDNSVVVATPDFNVVPVTAAPSGSYNAALAARAAAAASNNVAAGSSNSALSKATLATANVEATAPAAGKRWLGRAALLQKAAAEPAVQEVVGLGDADESAPSEKAAPAPSATQLEAQRPAAKRELG